MDDVKWLSDLMVFSNGEDVPLGIFSALFGCPGIFFLFFFKEEEEEDEKGENIFRSIYRRPSAAVWSTCSLRGLICSPFDLN